LCANKRHRGGSKKLDLTILIATEGDSREILIFTQPATKATSRDIMFYVSSCDRLCENYFQAIIGTKIDKNMCFTFKSDHVF
jgi:hypothetical protein